MIRFRLLSLVLASSFTAFTACSDPAPPATADETSDDEVRSRAKDPIGTFVGDSIQRDVFGPNTLDAISHLSLTMKNDRTYRFGVTTTCEPGPCPALLAQAGTVEESGAYELSKKGTK